MQTTVKGAIKTSGINFVQNLDEKGRKAASKDLYKKAIERWEAVLSYLALPSEKSINGVSVVTRELFQHIGFNKKCRLNTFNLTLYLVGDDYEITSLGFQFLLLGRTEQIWTYLIYYFKYIEVKHSEEDLSRLLEFFFRLASCVTVSDSELFICDVLKMCLIFSIRAQFC